MSRKSNNPNTGIIANDRLQNAREDANYYRNQYESLLKKFEELQEKLKKVCEEKDQACKEEIEVLKAKHKEELQVERMKNFALENGNRELSKTVEDLMAKVDELNTMMNAMAKASDAAAIKLQQLQAKPFIPTTEQRDILSYRYQKGDKRGQEKENFDGTP